MFAGPENAGAPEEPEALPPDGPEEPSEPAFVGVLNLSGHANGKTVGSTVFAHGR